MWHVRSRSGVATLRTAIHLLLTYLLTAVDIDRKAAAPAADAPCSNRSIWPARGAHSSKPVARSCSERMGQTDRQTDRPTDAVPLHRPCRILCEQCHPIIASLYLQAIETQNSLMVNLFNLFLNTVNLQPCFNFS